MSRYQMKSTATRILRRIYKCTVILSIVFVLTACGKQQPPKQQVASAVSTLLPPYYSVGAAEMEYEPTGGKAGVAKVKLEVSPKENLYVSGETDPKVLAESHKIGALNEQKAALREKAAENNIDMPSGAFAKIEAAIIRWNDLIKVVNGSWITAQAKVGQTTTVYGTVRAAYEFNEWRISDARTEQQLNLSAQPRSAFSSDALITASPNSENLAKQLAAAADEIQTALSYADKAVATALQVREDKVTSTLAALAPGTRYSGSSEGHAMYDAGPHPLAMQITTYDADAATVSLRFMSGQLSREYQGAVTTDRKTASVQIQLNPNGAPVAKTFNPVSMLFSGNCGVNLSFDSNGKVTGGYCVGSGEIKLMQTGRHQ